MAASAQSSSRRLVSPEIRALFKQRMGQIAALALLLGAVVLLVALATYNPHDPSLDTATSRPATNLAGPLGAAVADLLLQSFGVAAVLPALALIAWAWRAASGRGLGSPLLRLAALLLALPVLGAAFVPVSALLPDGHLAPWMARIGTLWLARLDAWPTAAGPAGVAGTLLGGWLMLAGRTVLGPVGSTVAWGLLGVLAVLLVLIALGLQARDYRGAGRGAARGAAGAMGAARLGVRHGRNAAGFARRLGSGGARLAALLRPARRELPDPVHEPRPDPVPPAPRVEPLPAAKLDPTPSPRAIPTPPPRKPAVPPAPQPTPPAEGAWRFPPLSLLRAAPSRAAAGRPSEDALQANARLLEGVLADYGVQGTIRDIRPGPVVTLYELEPAPGIRSARVIGLADDVARSLSVTAVRIATVPGRNVIGIEVPNATRETVFLSELLGSEEYQRNPSRLALALGKNIEGKPIVADLARMPHLLIAGTTGSGKSVGINAMILSLLYRLSPDQCRLIMIDPKMLELSVYEGIPHLLAPVVTEPAKAVTALKWTVRQMEKRYRAMSQLGVRNVGGYNERVAEARAKGEVVTRRVQTGFDAETGKPTFEEQPLTLEPLPFIVVVIDEMADLMMVAGKEIEVTVQRLAQMARAAGIHVIMATQRPSVDVITGTIKANFPTRISFQVISKFDSRTILGEQGAEQLLGQGDLLHMQGGGRIARVHGPFVEDGEVEEIVAFLRAQGEPSYVEEVTEADETADDSANPALSGIAAAGDGEKGLFDQAVALVSREGKASTSFIQRHLNIGYNRAAKLIEQMEKEGVVSAANHVGKREVLTRRTVEEEE
jgi:S-DNA-T family DNA segregation ATPase FtsK/SpoIIIE